LDQLVQEPEFKKTQGYVGRRVGPGVNPEDRYVIEPTASRTNYQLEPGVIEINPENSKEIIDRVCIVIHFNVNHGTKKNQRQLDRLGQF
jgi:hypothetical protein